MSKEKTPRLLLPSELQQFGKETFEALNKGMPADLIRKGVEKRGDPNLIYLIEEIIKVYEKRIKL